MFRNRYKAILASFLFGTLFTACVDDNVLDNEQVADMPTIQLRLSTDDLTTRAVTGNSAFTDIEKKMNTVFLYLFSYDATEASTPLKRVCLTDKKHGDKSTVTISTDSVSIVFGAAKKCRVYAVVNVSVDDFKAADVDTLKPTLKKLRELRAKTTTFSDKFNGFAMFTKDEKGDEITYDDTNRTAEGTVKLKNLASKIDIFASFGDENEIVEGVDPTGTLDGVRKWKLYKGTTDKPNEVYIVNGVQTVPLNGWSEQDYADGKLTAELSGTDYFDTRSPKTDNHFLKSSDETDKDKYPWVIAEPFYSYPNQWSNDAFEQHQTYLMLKVNWLPYEEDSPNVEDEIVETYYKIPVNVTDGTTIKSKDKLLSNVYYRVKVNINTLGGANYGEPVELTDCSWEALEWGESRLDADIHEIRWLEITQKQKDVYDGETYQAVMNNTNSVMLSYNSTHSIFLKKIEIKYYNFQTPAPYDPELVSVIAYKVGGKKPEAINRNNTPYDELKNMGVDPNVFLLDDEKLAWFKEQGEEPNGFYIDENNHTVTFYHSVYPLLGDNQSQGLPGKGEYYGVYKKNGDKTYSPYFITFTLAHVDKPDFEKTYTIKQYPGVFVEFIKNTGLNSKGISIGRKVSDGSTSGSQSRYGIYVNGGATDTWTAGEWYESAWREDNPSNSLQLGGIGGTLAEANKNQNMYAIHVTQLSDDEILRDLKYYDGNQSYTRDVTFHVGDPRTKFFNNNLSGAGDLVDEPHDVKDRWTATSYSTAVTSSGTATRNAFRRKPATKNEGGAQRFYPAPLNQEDPDAATTLCYYYPTAEGQLDEQAFMIAPVFRLASGKADLLQANTNSHTSDNLIRENARRRCASFQENGYPAGRWRLPTIGELYFYRMLYTKGVLPEIFNTTRAYWCAQFVTKLDFNDSRGGYSNIRPYPTVSDVSEKHVRCVYDDWYWVKDDGTADIIAEDDSRIDITGDYAKYYGDDDKRTMFVWGDKEKNNPQEQPTGN